MSKSAVLQWVILDDVAVSCSTDGEISNELWQTYLGQLKSNRVARVLSVTLGSTSLTSIQRKEAAKISQAQRIISAVVTDDKIVRGMLTALSWLGVELKGFSWDQLGDAVQFLKLPPMQCQHVIAAAEKLKESVIRGPHDPLKKA